MHQIMNIPGNHNKHKLLRYLHVKLVALIEAIIWDSIKARLEE